MPSGKKPTPSTAEKHRKIHKRLIKAGCTPDRLRHGFERLPRTNRSASREHPRGGHSLHDAFYMPGSPPAAFPPQNETLAPSFSATSVPAHLLHPEVERNYAHLSPPYYSQFNDMPTPSPTVPTIPHGTLAFAGHAPDRLYMQEHYQPPDQLQDPSYIEDGDPAQTYTQGGIPGPISFNPINQFSPSSHYQDGYQYNPDPTPYYDGTAHIPTFNNFASGSNVVYPSPQVNYMDYTDPSMVPRSIPGPSEGDARGNAFSYNYPPQFSQSDRPGEAYRK